MMLVLGKAHTVLSVPGSFIPWKWYSPCKLTFPRPLLLFALFFSYHPCTTILWPFPVSTRFCQNRHICINGQHLTTRIEVRIITEQWSNLSHRFFLFDLVHHPRSPPSLSFKPCRLHTIIHLLRWACSLPTNHRIVSCSINWACLIVIFSDTV